MKIPSQIYAIVFLLLGIALLVLADHSHNADVVKAMITAGGGLIVGASVAYQNEPKSTQPPTAPKEGA